MSRITLFPTINKNNLPHKDFVNDVFFNDIGETFKSLMDDVFTNKNRVCDLFKDKSRYPKTDVRENNDGLIFDMAIPGLTKEDVGITFEKNMLTIKYDKQAKENSQSESFIFQELKRSSFQRSWEILKEINEDEITANMSNGILSIYLPYKEPLEIKKEPKKIEIK